VRALIYLRVSTDEQASSVDTQEQGARAWCAREGHDVVATIRDVGWSGAEWERRPGLREIEAAARAEVPPWDLVVVRDVDRLGRDAVRLPLLLSELRDRGVAVVESSTGQTVALDGVGQLIASVKACLAQIERETIARRVRHAHATQHAAGRVVGGKVFGYRNTRTPAGVVYEIEPAEAAVVREIFGWAALGEGCREIARKLNARGVASPSAGRRGTGSWAPGVVYKILHSERYKGSLAWGATAKGYRGGTKIRRAGEVQRTERPELAIVDAETWEAAQATRDEVRVAAGRTRHRGGAPRHLLTGLAVCAACGGPLATTATRSGTVSVHAYCCAWRRDRGVCEAAWRRPTARLDAVVLDWLSTEVLSPDVVAEAVGIARRRLASAEPDPRVAALTDEEREISAAVSRLVAAVEAGGDLPEIMTRLRARRERLAAVRAELSGLARGATVIPHDLDATLRDVVSGLRDQLAADTAGAREILAAVLVGRLRVSWEGPRGRLRVEGEAELGGLLRGVVTEGPTRGKAASPEGRVDSPRLARVRLDRAI